MSRAESPRMRPYFYRITVTRVKDGDTVEANFDLGFRCTLSVVVRLLGVDAPETWRPVSEAEGKAGETVKQFLEGVLQQHAGKLYCASHKIDMYGRSLGTLYYESSGALIDINRAVNEFMLQEKLTQEQFRS